MGRSSSRRSNRIRHDSHVRQYRARLLQHPGGWSAPLASALQWWKALLQCPLYHRREHGHRRPAVTGWVDGSWDMDAGTGAIGGMILPSQVGGRSISARIPDHLCAELLQLGKKQRNTQAELLAVLVILFSCP